MCEGLSLLLGFAIPSSLVHFAIFSSKFLCFLGFNSLLIVSPLSEL